MARFQRGDPVSVVRTPARVVGYNKDTRHYTVSVEGSPGEFMEVPAANVTRREIPRGDPELSRGEPFESFGEGES